MASSRVEIAACQDQDLPTCFKVFSSSFGTTAPFVCTYYPQHWTEAGQKQGVARFLDWSRNEGTYFLKATKREADPANGGEQETIIGIAVWTHMKEAPDNLLDNVEDVKTIWPDETEREFMRRLWRSYVVPRSKVVREFQDAGVMVLELLAVHPDYQRQGAGLALTEWGTRMADQHGLVSIVESSPAGSNVYVKCGFITEIEKMEFDVGPEYEDRKKTLCSFMVRQVGSA